MVKKEGIFNPRPLDTKRGFVICQRRWPRMEVSLSIAWMPIRGHRLKPLSRGLFNDEKAKCLGIVARIVARMMVRLIVLCKID